MPMHGENHLGFIKRRQQDYSQFSKRVSFILLFPPNIYPATPEDQILLFYTNVY